MTKAEIHETLSEWLNNPRDKERIKELEGRFGQDRKALDHFREVVNDFDKAANLGDKAVNPYFFSKVRLKLEESSKPAIPVRGFRWTLYAAAVSISMVMGVFLGNQVYSAADNNSALTTDEELFSEELLVSDYSIDNALLVDVVVNENGEQ